MRSLTVEELSLVAGGTASSDYMDEFMGYPGYGGGGGSGAVGGGTGGGVFYIWHAVYNSVTVGGYPTTSGWGGYWEAVSFYDYQGAGGATGGSGSSSPPALGPAGIDLIGRDCPVDRAAAREGLADLYAGSPTAHALIDLAAAKGVDLNLIKANLAGGGAQDSFDQFGNDILWDPFLYVTGINSNGTTYNSAPILTLAHELVHAANATNPIYQGADSETLVISLQNQIARELNSYYGWSLDAARDSHQRTGQFNTNSITSTTYSLARPGCN